MSNGTFCAVCDTKTIRIAELEATNARLLEAYSKAITDVINERQRQIEKEGWSLNHDDEHDDGEMARAAACYAACGSVTSIESAFRMSDLLKELWPWSRDWWKPKDPRRDLVRAGALILAEIERIDRASATAKGDQ